MLEKFLKSGWAPFITGFGVILLYFYILPNGAKLTPEGFRVSPLHIIFTLLFVTACCIAAYFYGKRANKSGLFGLIGIFAPYLITLLLSVILPFVTPFAQAVTFSYLFVITFSYWTLFLVPFNIFLMFAMPVIMIVFIVTAWFIGFRKGGHYVNPYEQNKE